MRELLRWITARPVGVFAILAVAALLEAGGDSLFQSGLYRASGTGRVLWLAAGTVVLGCYGLTVNAPNWDFGKLLGVYVVLFFVMAQLLNKVRFHQSPTLPIYAGGALIVAGGAVIAFWRP
jgi:drug/metabolite transporter superfamily protein YnfA